MADSSFLFSIQDPNFRHWLFEGLVPLGRVEQGRVHLPQERLFEEIGDGEFRGRKLTLEQKNYLRNLFSRGQRRWGGQGKAYSEVSLAWRPPESPPYAAKNNIPQTFPQLKNKVENFFWACERNSIQGGSSTWGSFRDYLGERLFDTGTDEVGLLALLRSLKSPHELRGFSKLVQLDFRSGGKSLTTILQEELSGRQLGEALGVLESLKKGEGHYRGKLEETLSSEDLQHWEFLKLLPDMPEKKLWVNNFKKRLKARIVRQFNSLAPEERAYLKWDPKILDQSLSVSRLFILMKGLATLKTRQDLVFYQKQYTHLEFFRRSANTQHYFQAYESFRWEFRNYLQEISGDETSQDLEEKMVAVFREVSIYRYQEEVGQQSLQQNLLAAEETATMVAGASAAILVGTGLGSAGLAASILGGGIAGTGVSTGLRKLRSHMKGGREKFSTLLHAGALDGFGTSLGLGIGMGVSLGGLRWAARMETARRVGHLGVVAKGVHGLVQSPVTRQVLINEGIGLSNAVLRAEGDYGWDEMLILGASGVVGGKLDRHLINPRINLLGEAGREMGESLAENQFSREKGNVGPQEWIAGMGGAFTEMAGGMGRLGANKSLSLVSVSSPRRYIPVRIPSESPGTFNGPSPESPSGWNFAGPDGEQNFLPLAYLNRARRREGAGDFISAMASGQGGRGIPPVVRTSGEKTNLSATGDPKIASGLNDLLGDMRQIFHQTPSQLNFLEILGLIEEGRVNNYPRPLQDYARDHLKSWPDAIRSYRPKDVFALFAGGEIPYGLELVRGLDLHAQRLTSGHINLMTNFENLAHLTQLNISYNILQAGDIRRIGTSPFFKNLRVLDLSNTYLGPGQAQAFPYLGNLSQLLSLNLNNNSIETAGVSFLLFLESLTQLTHLGLAGNQIGPGGAVILSQYRGFSALTALDLEANLIGNAGVSALCRSPDLGNLRVLNLRGNQLGAFSARAIASNRYFSNLEHLDLSNNRIGVAGVRALADSANLSQLRHLNLRNNGLREEDVRVLRQLGNLPNLETIEI